MAEQRVTIEGTYPPGTAIPVTGTLSPSGTQNVSIVSPSTFPVSGTVTSTPSGTQNIAMPTNTALNPLYVASGMPSSQLFYTYSVTEAVGVVASNNFLSVFNPLASGKSLTFYRILVFPFSGGASTATRSMTITRISAASAGTLVAAANVPKFATSQANTVAEVRTGNPTVTVVGIPTLAFPPAISSAGSGTTSVATIVPPTGSSFICAPGEGIVFNVAAGDVDQLWNINATWSEG